MSVIVKGMEMPKQGWKCPLNGGGVCKLESLSCGKYIPALCPLRPLPEKHGRLGDLDLLQASFRESIEGCREWCKGAEEKGDDELVLVARQSLGTFVEACLRTKSMETIVEKED